MSLKNKAFLAALTLVNIHSSKAKIFLADKRLTQHEKMILMANLALRDFANQDAVDILIKFESLDQFVESQRLMCLGAAYNNLTRSAEAIKCFKKSIELNNYQAAKERKLATTLSLYTVYINTNDVSGMVSLLEQIRSLVVDSTHFQHIIPFCEFALAIQQRNFEIAKKLLPIVETLSPKLNEHHAVAYLFDLFELYIFENEFEAALTVMDRLKQFRKYKNTAEIKYMKSVTSFLTNNTPMYLYENDYKDYPLLRMQINCLIALEKGDQSSAKTAWEHLQLIQPSHFSEAFKYNGQPNLFSKCLDKLLTPAKVKTIIISKPDSLEARFISLLKDSSFPVSKEVLYSELWGRPIETKDDLKRLVKVAQKARKKYLVNIKTIKGAYLLDIKKKAS